MIIEETPLSMVEAAKDVDEELKGFIKKFTSLTPEQGAELKEKLKALGLVKLKERDLVKIVDILPEDKEDVNKIFTEVSLDEEEINKILDVVKEYK